MSPVAPVDHNLEFLSVLGLRQPVTVEDVKQAYLDKAKAAHPDRGGDMQQFIRLQNAFEQATEYAHFTAGRMQWLTRWVEQYAEQQQLIDEIKALGGTVEVAPCDWLTQSIGPDFATVLDRVQAIRLSGPRIDDAVLLGLTTRRRILAGLRRLELFDTSITPVSLQHLRDLQTLNHLDLTGTAAGPRVVELLIRNLPELRTLTLRRTAIGWWGRLKLRWVRRDLAISA
jgi:hypothetical protein